MTVDKVAQGGLQLPPTAAILLSEADPPQKPPAIGTGLTERPFTAVGEIGTPTKPFLYIMSVTLTANYKETLAAATVEKIDELLEENYALDDMLEFIDQHNESDFVAHYEDYCTAGEAIGYDAVDALIEEMGDVCYVEGCEERYRGNYDSTADFAEQFYDDLYDVPSALVVDWEATYDSSLRYDFTACEKGYRNVYIFSDY